MLFLSCGGISDLLKFQDNISNVNPETLLEEIYGLVMNKSTFFIESNRAFTFSYPAEASEPVIGRPQISGSQNYLKQRMTYVYLSILTPE